MQFIDFFNNPNVGLFFYTTDKITIIPSITSKNVRDAIKDELKTKIIECNVYESNVNNIFLSGNNEYLFAPSIISKDELKTLKKTGLKVVLLDTKLNALGNNLVFKDTNVLVNPKLENSIISQLEGLGFNVFKSSIAKVDTVGANIIIFGEKALINPETTSKELNIITKSLGVECERGTVNNKSNIVKAGVISNKQGILVSRSMTGPEMMVLEDLWRKGYDKDES